MQFSSPIIHSMLDNCYGNMYLKLKKTKQTVQNHYKQIRPPASPGSKLAKLEECLELLHTNKHSKIQS